MTEEEAVILVSKWLNGGDKLMNKMETEGYHVLAHIISDACTMVQDEALSLIVNDKPMRYRT